MNKVLFPKKDYVKELVRFFKSSKNSQKLIKTLSKYHEKDIAEAITLLTPAERQNIYNVLDDPFGFMCFYEEKQRVKSKEPHGFKIKAFEFFTLHSPYFIG